jgi:hypothetical protein
MADGVHGLLDVAVVGHVRVDAVDIGSGKPWAVRTKPLEGVGRRVALEVDPDVLDRGQQEVLGHGGGRDGEGCDEELDVRHGVVLNEWMGWGLPWGQNARGTTYIPPCLYIYKYTR